MTLEEFMSSGDKPQGTMSLDEFMGVDVLNGDLSQTDGFSETPPEWQAQMAKLQEGWRDAAQPDPEAEQMATEWWKQKRLAEQVGELPPYATELERLTFNRRKELITGEPTESELPTLEAAYENETDAAKKKELLWELRAAQVRDRIRRARLAGDIADIKWTGSSPEQKILEERAAVEAGLGPDMALANAPLMRGATTGVANASSNLAEAALRILPGEGAPSQLADTIGRQRAAEGQRQILLDSQQGAVAALPNAVVQMTGEYLPLAAAGVPAPVQVAARGMNDAYLQSDDDGYALTSGIVQGALTYAGGKLAGGTFIDMLSGKVAGKALGPMLKGFGMESVEELGQLYGQAMIDRGYGVGDGKMPTLKEAMWTLAVVAGARGVGTATSANIEDDGIVEPSPFDELKNFSDRKWPSRKAAKEAGVDQIATTAKERSELAADIRDRLTGEDVTKQLYDAATSPEEAEMDIALLKARSASAGVTFDEYVGTRIKGFEKTTKTEAEPLRSGRIRPDGRRGEIEFLQEGRAIIRAFETQTVATIPHELWHLFRKDLEGKGWENDLRTVERWAGVKNGKWDRKAEEKWARGGERYLAEGKAPVPHLQRVFDKFKEWMGNVYSVITKSPININITPEVRAVYDRLLTPQASTTAENGISRDIAGQQTGQQIPTGQPPEVGTPGNTPPDILSQAPVSPDLAAKNASMDEARAAMGLPAINKPAAPGANMPHHIAEQEAIRQRIPERAAGIVMDYLSGKRNEPLNQLETAGLAVYGDRLNEAYASLSEDVNNLTLDEGERRTKAAEMERIEQDFDLLSRAMRQSGTAQSLAFSQRKHIVGSDYRPLSVEAKATAAKGDKLTPNEKRKVKKAVDEHTAAEKKLADQEAKEATTAKEKRKAIKTEAKKLKEKIAKAKLPTDLRRYARDLAKQYLAEGVTGRRELIDKVQKAVREVFPETQRRQVIDAISGYGDFTQLSKDEVSVRLRDLKGQLQQISKLKDMSEGKAPAKTGMERRTPSDEERGLIKEVNEAKKAGGYEVTDPAKQLASALSTIKTRLRNQIKDLQAQIDSKQKRVKDRKDSPSDEETKRLTAERDDLKKQFEDIFGKPGLSEAQRIANAEKAVQKSIDEYERRLAAGDFKPRPKRHSNPVPEKLAAMRDRAAALRQKYADANPNSSAIEKAKERLETLRAHLRNGTLPTTTPRTESRNPAVKALQQQLADARKQLSESEPAQKARLLKSIGELNAKLQAGNFSLPEGAPRPISPEIERLQYERDKARRKIRAEINALRPQTIWGHISSPFNAARSIITTLDFPPVFRQGGFIAMGNPVRAAKATAEGFKAMFSDFNARKSLQKIQERPNAPLYARAKLYIADMDGSPSAREEAFIGRLVESIPLVRDAVHASERNYTVFLNQLRADTFDAMAASFAKNGEPTMEEARAIARFINVATGRGDFGGMEQAMTGLAPVFFSPRYVASRFQLLAGQPMYGGTAETRALIAKEYAKFLAGTAVLMAIAMAAGAELEEDPTSSDFGKLKFGNTRLDPLGGLSQTAVITSRMGSGVKKTLDSWASGEPRETEFLQDEGRMAWNFLRSKLSPVAAQPLNLAIGQTAGREDVTPGQIAKDMSIPLSFRDVYAATQDQGVPKGVALWLVSMFGMGMQTYEDN